jgi:hypothetical protein
MQYDLLKSADGNRDHISNAYPAMGRIKTARDFYGVSRSWLYREAAKHPGLMRKCGRSTLVDFTVLREIIAGLPVARIAQQGGQA